MPVNDATDSKAATTNCALCTLAGLVNSTAEKVRNSIETALKAKSVAADMAFYWYAVALGLAPKDLYGMAPTRAQVTGMQAWLLRFGRSPTSLFGSVDSPLQRDLLIKAMKAAPDGSCFACLILSDEIALGIRESHWIAANRYKGELIFTDYQLDLPQSATFTRAEMIKEHRKGGGNDWPAIESETPRGPFGTPFLDSYRMMAIARLVWAPAKPQGGEQRKLIGGHRAITK